MNVHGGYYGNNKKEILDFSVNLNPLGVPESVKAYIVNNLGALDTYPEIEARTARQYLAREHGLKSGNIIMGNGAECIHYFLKANDDFASLEGKYIRIALRGRAENILLLEALMAIQEALKEKKEVLSLSF